MELPSAAPIAASATLFVADIPYGVSELELSELFQAFAGFKNARLRKDRLSNTVGFIDFEDANTAAVAKDRLQNYQFQGRSADKGITIQFSHPQTGTARTTRRRPEVPRGRDRDDHSPRPAYLPLVTPEFSSVPMLPSFNYANLPADASSTLYVEGLPPDATDREVAHIFRRFPSFLSVRILPRESKTSNRTVNLCFVEFENKYQATMAMMTLQGYPMVKDPAPDEPRYSLNIQYAKIKKRTQ